MLFTIRLVLHSKKIALVKEERLLKDLAASGGLQFAEQDFEGVCKGKTPPHIHFSGLVGGANWRADQCDDEPGFPVVNE